MLHPSRRSPALALLLLSAACAPPAAPKKGADAGAPASAAPVAAPAPDTPPAATPAPEAVAPATPPAPDVVPLPDSLVARGIPPVPKAIAEAVGAYSEMRTAVDLGWHPRERWLLISTRFADTNQVHEVRAPGGARRQLTFFPDKVVTATYPPAGDGDSLLFSKDRGGNEFAQNWRLDLATGRVTLLTDGASKNTLGAFDDEGKRLVYTSTRRSGKDTDLYVVDPRRPESDRLLAAVDGGGWQVAAWSPDGGTILVEEYVSVNSSHLWLFDAVSGERHRLTPEPGATPVAWSGGEFTADGKAVITATDVAGEYSQLVRLDLHSRALTPISGAIPWDVEGFALSRDGRSLAALTNEDGISRLHLYDALTLREARTPALPDGVIGGLAWHPQGRHLAFTVSSARSPSDVWSLDTRSGALDRWTESETGGLPVADFAEPALIRWKSFDGREIPGFYYRPPARFTGKRPVVVIIHGGPEGQSRVGFIGRNNYLLGELGVALIYPNVRGSTGYGKTYVALDNGQKREDSVQDIGALLDWIAAQPDLDPERVMIMGGSYGGYMTLATSVRYADRIRCAVDIVGISNFVTFLENTEAYRRDLRRVEYGDERDPAMREFLNTISPLTRADAIKKPLFVIQGKNDPRVPASEAEQIVRTLEERGTPVWYLEGKDEGHGFAKKRNQDYQMYATILFMQRYLLDGMAAE